MKGKKGQVLGALSSLAIGIATLAIVLTVTFLVMAQGRAQDQVITGVGCNGTSGSIGCNATQELQQAVDTIPGWVPLIVIAVIIVLNTREN